MKRTISQNKAMHLYFRMLAEALNDAGYDMKTFLMLAPKLEIPWTEESVKEMWRKVQIPMTGIESTADLDKLQVDEIYKVIDSRIAQLTGVTVEFPSEESLYTGEER